ncbi:MAG: hypothetical protein JSR17_03755 [Proteobacteria bacterium]|nr:hypothetical protein [Pseudomonadota bacterium]
MKAKSKGFTLLAIIFILVVLSLAGMYLLKLSVGKQQMINYALLTTRARLATLSAFELAQQSLFLHTCQDKTYSFTKVKGLNGFEVKITCEQYLAYPAQNPTFFAWQLKANATYGVFGDRDFVSYETTRWFEQKINTVSAIADPKSS